MEILRLDNQSLLVDESIYSTANGYIGVRSNFEEGYKNSFESTRGSYLNGFYDTHNIKYSENAYGFPDVGETMVNVLDGQTILFRLNGELFSMNNGRILEIERCLDVYNGFSSRVVKWESPKGDLLKFEFKRLTSFITPELFLIDIKVTSINFVGTVEIISTIELPEVMKTDNNDPRIVMDHVLPLEIINTKIENDIIALSAKTGQSRKGIQLTCSHSLNFEYEIIKGGIEGKYSQSLSNSETLEFTKYCIYTDEHKHKNYLSHGCSILNEVLSKSVLEVFHDQKQYLDIFWSYSKITINGDAEVEKAIAFSMYQLLSSAGKDSISQIAAKGLSGAGYEGHYFWDTEIYMLPFFILTQPDIAKQLLRYRYLTLSKSRERALQLGHNKGVKIPWRTISGNECSSYFPAGTAQYHINADVAYSYIQYYLYTDDFEMIEEFGFETLLETARLWMDVGHFKSGEFRIDAVTGPDEYTAIVNNNYYTNVMAKYHLTWVVKLYKKLLNDSPNVIEKLNIKIDEIDNMLLAANQMYLPFDEKLNINLQDDSFINKKVWDFACTPKENYPLLLNYHPLTIYRHQVLKQADTILAHFLLDDTSDDILESSFNYYEKITTHDSSLSPCVYGMMASRINDPQKAYDYLMKTIYLDLDNLHGNTKDGLHIANAGGAYMAIIYGFAGLRIKEDALHLKPTKPSKWTDYSFKLNYKNALVKVTVGEKVRIVTDKDINIIIDDKSYDISDILEVSYNGKH